MPDYRRPVAVKFQKTPPAGNRVYTDLREDELYVAVPGKGRMRSRPSPQPTRNCPSTAAGADRIGDGIAGR